MATTFCKWHECGKPFERGHHLQTFCSAECRAARTDWKVRRGPPIVDVLLYGTASDILDMKHKLEMEIEDGRNAKT